MVVLVTIQLVSTWHRQETKVSRQLRITLGLLSKTWTIDRSPTNFKVFGARIILLEPSHPPLPLRYFCLQRLFILYMTRLTVPWQVINHTFTRSHLSRYLVQLAFGIWPCITRPGTCSLIQKISTEKATGVIWSIPIDLSSIEAQAVWVKEFFRFLSNLEVFDYPQTRQIGEFAVATRFLPANSILQLPAPPDNSSFSVVRKSRVALRYLHSLDLLNSPAVCSNPCSNRRFLVTSEHHEDRCC